MTEERLKEIYDYNNTEYCVGEYDINNEIIDELYNEVVRLRENNNKVIDLIEPLVEWGECTINGKMLKAIYDILKEK